MTSPIERDVTRPLCELSLFIGRVGRMIMFMQAAEDLQVPGLLWYLCMQCKTTTSSGETISYIAPLMQCKKTDMMLRLHKISRQQQSLEADDGIQPYISLFLLCRVFSTGSYLWMLVCLIIFQVLFFFSHVFYQMSFPDGHAKYIPRTCVIFHLVCHVRS